MSIKQGEYLKKLRIENNLSQEKLGERLGLSRQSISKWEQGTASPDIENIVKLSELYNVSVDSILKGEEVAGTPVAEPVMIEEKEEPKQKVKHSWVFYSYPVLMLILYALLGCFCSPKGWYMGWVVFLTIPLYYTGVIARSKKKPIIFCYPVLVVLVYLLLGLLLHLWHPAWIIFLTIPIFYIITARRSK